MIIITGSVLLNPPQREHAIRIGCEHSARSRDEDGCIAHNCCIDAENPNRLIFIEQWRNMDAVQKHFAVSTSAAFVKELTGYAAAPPEMQIFDATENPRS